MSNHLTCNIDERGVATVTLNRPDVHNAFNERLIAQLTDTFKALADDEVVRLAVLRGEGKSFSAGADLNMMKEMKDAGADKNREQGLRLATMFDTINAFPKPLIGVVQGAAFGGGIGLISVCDYVLAAESANFGLSEVRLGMVPATIAPYVIKKIGESNARAFFLSGATFNAHQAYHAQLIHKKVADSELDAATDSLVDEFLKAGPEAARHAKKLITDLADMFDVNARKEFTAELIAFMREGDEAQEGMEAFLSKRKPKWAA